MKDTTRILIAATILSLVAGFVFYFCYDANDFVVADRVSAENWESEPDPNEPITFTYQSEVPPIMYWIDEDGNKFEYAPVEPEPPEPNTVFSFDSNNKIESGTVSQIEHQFYISSEPNEAELNDPNDSTYFTSDYAVIWENFISDTVSVNDVTIYVKNTHLLTKEELRDFALFISSVSAVGGMCEEYYEGLLKLVPTKLLQDPNDD